jgi:integrase
MAKKPNKTETTITKGIFTKHSTNLLYVRGTIEGKTYKDVPTGLKYTNVNLSYVKKHKLDIIREYAGMKITTNSPTLIEYGRKVLEQGSKRPTATGIVGKKGRNIKNQSQALERWENHVKPFFKNQLISNVTVEDINNWQNQLTNKRTNQPLSTSTSKAIKSDLESVFFSAVGDDLVVKNVVTYSQSIEVFSQDRGYYSPTDAQKLLDNSHSLMRVYLELLVKYGLRSSENNGTMINDFDLDRGVLFLERSLNDGHHVATTTKDPNLSYLIETFDPLKEGKVLSYKASKKNHRRVIVLSDETTDILRAYISLLPKNQNFLFVTAFKKPFSGSKNINKKLRKLCEITGVTYLGSHAFRHGMITMSRAEGIDPQSTVGHSEGSSVTDRYDHELLTETVINTKRKEAESVERLLKGNR